MKKSLFYHLIAITNASWLHILLLFLNRFQMFTEPYITHNIYIIIFLSYLTYLFVPGKDFRTAINVCVSKEKVQFQTSLWEILSDINSFEQCGFRNHWICLLSKQIKITHYKNLSKGVKGFFKNNLHNSKVDFLNLNVEYHICGANNSACN